MITPGRTFRVTPTILRLMGIGETYWDVSFDAIPEVCAYKATLKKFCERLAGACRDGLGLVFHGEPRQGKTGAAVLCLREVAACGGEGYFIRADGLAGAIMEREQTEDDASVEEKCRAADVLVVDDLGQGGGRLETHSMMEKLLRYRYDHKKSVVITTNSLKLVSERYGEATSRLLASRCLPVKVEGTKFFDDEKERTRKFFA